MWKGWISLLVAGWFLVSGAVSQLQTASVLMVVGGILIVIGIIKIRSWHDLASIAFGVWLLFSSAMGWVSSTVFFVSAIIVGYFGIMYVRLNIPELSNKNA